MPSKSAQKKVVEPVVAVADVAAPEPKKSKAKVAPATEVPVVTKKETKPRAKKDAAPVVVAPAVDAENVVVAESSVDTSIADGFTEFIVKFGGMVQQFAALKTELKTLERKVAKQLKVVEKIQNKKKRKGTRAPSGFVKPSPISDELATFLGKAPGTEMARTDVTREINKYIRANDLQDKNNGRVILADTKLRKLLKLNKSDELTYFNLQRYMSPHFATAKNNKLASQ